MFIIYSLRELLIIKQIIIICLVCSVGHVDRSEKLRSTEEFDYPSATMNLCLAVSLVSCTVGYVPVAPWLNAKDCNAAIAQQIAWHNKRYPYQSIPASLINHCKHGK